MADKCPHCGGLLFLSKVPLPYAGGGAARRGQVFHSAANPFDKSIPAEGDWYRATPVGRLEPKDVLTQLLDAGVSFTLVSIGAGGLAWYFEGPAVIGPALGFGVACWRYFDGLAGARRLLEAVEEWKEKRERARETEPQKHVVKAEVRDPEGRWQFAEFEIDPARLHNLAGDILAGRGFTERAAKRAGIPQADFYRLRDRFVENGWAVWKHPENKQQGVQLNRKGLALMRAIAEAPLPSPAGE